jgi:hypothetical protein
MTTTGYFGDDAHPFSKDASDERDDRTAENFSQRDDGRRTGRGNSVGKRPILDYQDYHARTKS